MMDPGQAVPIGNVACGRGQPLLWIAGPCVIESHDLTLKIADQLRERADHFQKARTPECRASEAPLPPLSIPEES